MSLYSNTPWTLTKDGKRVHFGPRPFRVLFKRLMHFIGFSFVLCSPAFSSSEGMVLKDRNRTQFNEDIIAIRTQNLEIKPTWGVSVIRDSITVVGTGAAIAETGGEIQIQTGTDAGAVSKIQSVFRGQYHPGAIGESGIGVRIPTLPTGTQYSEWGYTDEDNGLGFGVDATGEYVFTRSNSVTKKYYQDSWNVDKFNGSSSTANPSGIDFTLSSGAIFTIRFTWYGYGDARFYINYGNDYGESHKYLVHIATFGGSISIQDPNQPLSVLASNGVTTASNFSVFLGGRQHSQVGPLLDGFFRPVTEQATLRTLGTAQNVWEPIITLRLKTTFGDSNRPNSIRAKLLGYEISCDNDSEFKLTVSTDSSITGTPNWGTPTDWDPTETASETRIQAGSLSVASTGLALSRTICIGGVGARSTRSTEDIVIPIPLDREVVLWARRVTANATVVSAVLSWEEFW